MNISIQLKDRVYQLRKQAGLSQQQLGKVLGLSHKSISMLESGGRGTTIEKLVLLAEYFQVSTDYLLGITEDPTWRGAPAIPEDGSHSLELTQGPEPQGPPSLEPQSQTAGRKG